MKYFLLFLSPLLFISCGSKEDINKGSTSSQVIQNYPSTNTGTVSFDSEKTYSENLSSEEIRKSGRP